MGQENDPLIEGFFAQMKSLEEKQDAPNILSQIKRNRRTRKIRSGLMIAASFSLILMISWWFSRPGKNPSQNRVSEAEIDEMEKSIESMMSWESATSSLINN